MQAHTLQLCDILYKRLINNLLTYFTKYTQQAIYSHVRVGLQTVEIDELTHISVITTV